MKKLYYHGINRGIYECRYDLFITSPHSVFSTNITHNLVPMAEEAGLYIPIWRPEEGNYTHAKDIIPLLEKGLALLIAEPDRFTPFNPTNLWGSYESFIKSVTNYLAYCKEYPDAEIKVSR